MKAKTVLLAAGVIAGAIGVALTTHAIGFAGTLGVIFMLFGDSLTKIAGKVGQQ